MGSESNGKSEPVARSGGSAAFGAIVALLSFSVLLQLAAVVLLVMLLMGERNDGSPIPTAQSREGSADTSAQNHPNDGTPVASDLRIRPASELPRSMPETERSFAWYTVGDELFSIDSTTISSLPHLANSASIRVHGRGLLMVKEGTKLFPDSRVRLDRVSGNRVTVSTAEDSREISATSTGGMQWSDAPRSMIGASSEDPPIKVEDRSKDPRVAELIEDMKATRPDLHRPEAGSTSPATVGDAATRPITPEPDTGLGPTGLPLGKPVVMTYPARDWNNFVVEVRDALTGGVLVLDSFDNNYKPNGVTLKTFIDDAPLFAYLKVEEGDRVTAVNGVPVMNKFQFDEQIRGNAFKNSISLTVAREGREVPVRLDKFPQG